MLFGSIFHDLIVQPIFNVLVAIYALLPGHDFGLAIILFTILVRICMLPVVRRQLHQTKIMRMMQPDIKRIKAEAKGNRQKEQLMLMELYKERGISPFGQLGVLIVQFVVLIGLYLGLKHVVDDPKAILDQSYGFIRDLPWMQTLSQDLGQFKQSLLGLVDLGRPALGKTPGIYWPAMLLVFGSALAQYMVTVQLLPKAKDARSLRDVFREASEGKQADQADISASVARSTRFLVPGFILVFTVNLPAALSLYWLVGGIVAYIQQDRILNQDEEEMEHMADADSTPASTKRAVIEGEVVESPAPKSKKQKKAPAKAKKASVKKRRKK